MSKILCSTGALIGQPNNRDYRLLAPLAKELSCDGFEFMMYSSWYEQADQLAQVVRSMQLYIPVFHCEKHIGQKISEGGEEALQEALRLYRINCRVAQQIGAEKMVVHLWDGTISDSHFQNNLQGLAQLLEISKEYGIQLLVENVVCNVENPMKHWEELVQCYPQVQFVFDTKMAAFHQQLELLYQEEYSWLWKDGHICHYHVNDYGGGYMDWANLRTLPLGRGHIDFDRFFTFIRKTGYDDTYTVEATAFNKEGAVDTDMLNRCFEVIRSHIK